VSRIFRSSKISSNSRALVEILSHPVLHDALAFRGGTALYKLLLKPAVRYSEDIDLVQTTATAAGAMMEALRGVLDPWLALLTGAPIRYSATLLNLIHHRSVLPPTSKASSHSRDRQGLFSIAVNQHVTVRADHS
jgi:hypothetical protein